MVHILTLAGDGIGPEITEATRAVLEALDRRHDLSLEFESRDVGFAALEAVGTTVPPELLDAARAADGILLGPVSTAEYPAREAGGINPSAALRIALDLFANLRPSYVRSGLPAKVAPLDVMIVRENTEGFYADRTMFAGGGEFMPTPDLALAVRKVTREGSRRIAQAAFEEARRRRGAVTIVHKGNVLKLSDGLFLEECRKAAAAYPDIRVDDEHIDAMVSHLVRSPERFDVIVSTNMFGDILSNLAAELSGGLGLAESLNAGAGHAMAQASHGSAPDIAGRDIANPTALILSAGMMLDWIGERHGTQRFCEAACELKRRVLGTLTDERHRTRDLGGTASTRDFTKAVIAALG
ncbi:isocitrate/isopropylmalate dehydrogenase family protein [Aureimonas frigidaquae]|uniref:isocitrate/isopropylmalate dehydrogenase family protein n=1 Tax=Aureimonas frigidaquae TaxID=424757 RepID=UPI000A4DE2F1|nr:isocitrate/isopropylmalate dehydrogenase family protein [Aureimonas frigidaquae]